MRFDCILMFGMAWLCFAGCSSAEPHQRLRSARFFLDGERNPTLLAAVRAGTDRKIGFDRHFSMAFVSCGLACGGYFFVDRRSGAVILAPESPAEDEMTWDIAARPDSDTIKITYGQRDGLGSTCSAQHFRWNGRRFVGVDKRASVACPK